MGRPTVFTLALAAANATGYTSTQTLVAAGPINFSGPLIVNGVGTPDAPRRVVIHSNGNDSGMKWTINGTARPEMGGSVLAETITGGNASDAVSTQDFATVTSIVGSAATASTFTAGTTATGSSAWFPTDVNVLTRFLLRISVYITVGSPTIQIDVTDDDVFGAFLPAGVPFPRSVAWTPSVGAVNWQGLIDQPIRGARVTITALSGPPNTVQATFTQGGN